MSHWDRDCVRTLGHRATWAASLFLLMLLPSVSIADYAVTNIYTGMPGSFFLIPFEGESFATEDLACQSVESEVEAWAATFSATPTAYTGVVDYESARYCSWDFDGGPYPSMFGAQVEEVGGDPDPDPDPEPDCEEDFDVSCIDSSRAGGFFSAGFFIVAVCWGIGKGAATILGLVRRG